MGKYYEEVRTVTEDHCWYTIERDSSLSVFPQFRTPPNGFRRLYPNDFFLWKQMVRGGNHAVK